jgi:hypothetical protein
MPWPNRLDGNRRGAFGSAMFLSLSRSLAIQGNTDPTNGPTIPGSSAHRKVARNGFGEDLLRADFWPGITWFAHHARRNNPRSGFSIAPSKRA